MSLYELNKKFEIARQRGFILNEINNFQIKIYSNLQSIYLHHYMKLRIPIMHRHLFKIISQKKEYVERFCNDRNNPFHFECSRWYS